MKAWSSRILMAVCGTLFAFGISGCHTDMWVQPKVKHQSESDFFSDGMGARPTVRGTVEFGEDRSDSAFYTGFENGKLVEQFPIPLTEELLRRGRERFEIFCLHCHGAAGDGKGMIAQRGFTLARPVADYNTDRLREMPIGHFFDVMTNGYGAMFPFGARIEPEDRWAIAAYIRALQLSQHLPVGELNSEQRSKIGQPIDWSKFDIRVPVDPLEPAAEGGGH